MNTNYKTVTLIIHCPDRIAMWVEEGRITKEDVSIAMGYIKEQNILSLEEFREKEKYLSTTAGFLKELEIAFSAGINANDLEKLMVSAVVSYHKIEGK